MGHGITIHPAMKLRKLLVFLSVAALFMVILTIIQDFLHADFNNGSFYFSESLLFTSFWWLFLPGYLFQHWLIQQPGKSIISHLLSVALPLLLHIVSFPALIWLLSGIFMNHQFEFVQTLRFSLSTYLYVSVLFYSIPVLTQVISRRPKTELTSEKYRDPSAAIEAILVNEGRNVIRVELKDILYFKANTPYVDIQHKKKTYLSNDSLKGLRNKLRESDFMQIHRSTIINLKEVTSYKTRLNGDYDVTMSNGAQLRLSRNYASEFKSRI